ncbi:MAG: hypothetical protein U1F98_15240 [Verrucomicrobiota bacterium]
MARNRKHQTAAIRFGPAVKAVLLCALIGGSGVGFVWQKSQIDDLGRQIGKREARLRELNEQNKKLRDQLAAMRSVQFLEARIRELNLGLAMPQPSQVWRIAEPEPASDRKDAPRQYASQTHPGTVPE